MTLLVKSFTDGKKHPSHRPPNNNAYTTFGKKTGEGQKGQRSDILAYEFHRANVQTTALPRRSRLK